MDKPRHDKKNSKITAVKQSKNSRKTIAKPTPPKTLPKLKIKRSVRFKSEPMTLGYLDLETTNSFNPQLIGIVLNESFTGCALILAIDDELKVKQQIKIKVGNLDPIKASVSWFKILDENILKVGLKFIS